MSDLRTIHDQMGREVTFPFPPKRIISLVPSQTEFLIDIGASVVGRTKFCIHPHDHVREIPVIGGTKKFRFDKIKELQPDLIIGNKEENYEQGIQELEEYFPVWMSDIYSLEDAFDMMLSLGQICNRAAQAVKIVKDCRSATLGIKGSRSGKVIYLIWQNPWMAAGNNTFIDHMLGHLGYENVVKAERYPELTDEEISRLDPDHILFSSEPYPFKKSHLESAKNKWPMANSQLVDGELYSWYGSRLKNVSIL